MSKRLSPRYLRKLARAHARLEKQSAEKFSLSHLPQNDELDSVIALNIFNKKDARSMLSFTKNFLQSTLLSLASPVGPWDPYDVKPQIFALDTNIALPVFTHVKHLQTFCHKFQFSVRDPTGNLWSDGSPALTSSTTAKGIKKKRSFQQDPSLGTPTEESEQFWKTVSSSHTLQIKQATPLPMFGPFVRPFFVGYFGDVETLLSNVSIAPEKVDIVLNPCTPIEMVLAREATDHVLRRESLILRAFQELEKEIRSEFFRCLSLHCDEVELASSACIAKAHNSELFKNYIDYEIVVILKSRDMNRTWAALSYAKRCGQLIGHASLVILPEEAAAPHARASATLFYSASQHASQVGSRMSELANRTLGVMEQKGNTATVRVGTDTDSYFSDPSSFFTEPHSVYTNQFTKP